MSDGDSEDRHTTSFRKLARARPRVQGEGEVGKKNIVIDRRTVTDTLLSRKNRYGNTGETPDAIRDTRWSPLGCH